MSRDEQAIESEIRAKGLNAPRLSPEKIDEVIAGEYYFTAENGVRGGDVFEGGDGYSGVNVPLPLTTITFCILVLRNGFTVTGESACASPENFDRAIGRTIARRNARDKIWALEGYLLRERLDSE